MTLEAPAAKTALVTPLPAPPPDTKSPKAAPKHREGAAPEGSRKGDVCYVRGDQHATFAQTKTRTRYVRDPLDESCWDCIAKPPKSVQLNDPGCAAFRKCTKLEDPAKCSD